MIFLSPLGLQSISTPTLIGSLFQVFKELSSLRFSGEGLKSYAIQIRFASLSKNFFVFLLREALRELLEVMKKECCALFVRLAVLDSSSSGLRIMRRNFCLVKAFKHALDGFFSELRKNPSKSKMKSVKNFYAASRPLGERRLSSSFASCKRVISLSLRHARAAHVPDLPRC